MLSLPPATYLLCIFCHDNQWGGVSTFWALLTELNKTVHQPAVPPEGEFNFVFSSSDQFSFYKINTPKPLTHRDPPNSQTPEGCHCSKWAVLAQNRLPGIGRGTEVMEDTYPLGEQYCLSTEIWPRPHLGNRIVMDPSRHLRGQEVIDVTPLSTCSCKVTYALSSHWYQWEPYPASITVTISQDQAFKDKYAAQMSGHSS